MKETCGACLSTSSLFDWNTILAGKMSYADLFFHITSLNKHNFENMQLLCNNCGSQVREIYDFIQKAIKAQAAFKYEMCVQYNEETDELDKVHVENLSIEIAPFTEEEIQRHREKQCVKEENDSDYSQNEINIESADDCEHLDTPEHQISDDIKFEMVDVNGQDNFLEKDFFAECNSLNDTSQSVLSEKPQKVKKIADKAPLICEYCGKSFKSQSYRKRHMAVHNVGRILCDVCPRTFKNIWGLTKHKKTHDENRKRNYTCQCCGLKFLTSNALKGHQEIHDDKREKRFACDQCDKAFFQKGALNVHRRIHTGDMVQCKICGKSYPRVVDLELHMRSHTGEQPFKCSTCGNAFKYVSTLYNHVRKAHFGYIYKCSFCSKQYKDKQALIDHKKVHKNATFKCALCDKEMVKKYRLKCHMKTIHNIQDPIELEQMIISNKAESKHRTMRKFTNVEYKIHVAQPVQDLSSPAYQKIVQEKNFDSDDETMQEMVAEYAID